MATGGGGATTKKAGRSGSGSSGGGRTGVGMGTELTMEQYLALVDQLMGMGYDQGTAMRLAGGGGGGSGGGGGGGGYIDTAARDAAIANVASTYANAEAGLKVSDEVYRKISGDERASGAAATAAAQSGAQQSYDDAVRKRALERRALGIEDAAKVGTDAVVTEKKIADDNTRRNEERMATRTQGHLDNNIKFNTDLRAVVNLEGKERQKDIADYYAGQLAQIAARRSGGGGGGSRSGGSRSGSSSSKGLTPGQRWNAARDLQADDLRRLQAMNMPGQYQTMYSNLQTTYPDYSPSNLTSLTKLFTGNPYKR